MPLPAVIHCTSPATERALVAEAVLVVDRAGENIGDGLDAAVRMPGKAGAVVIGAIVAEIVEQQERIELGGIAEAEGAAQLDAGALNGWLGLDDAFDGSNGHDGLRFHGYRRAIGFSGCLSHTRAVVADHDG